MWKNRIVPTLLALCMVMALLPVSVFAEEPAAPKCACTTNHDGGDDHSQEGGCSAAPVNGDTKCKACGGVEKFQCACDGSCVANFTGTHAVGCTGEAYSVATEGDKCDACKAAITASQGPCTNGGANNGKCFACTGATHYEGCPKYNAADDPSKEKFTVADWEITVDCTCGKNHDAESNAHVEEVRTANPCANDVTIKITGVTYYYDKLAADATDKQEEAWATGKADAEAAAKTAAENAAKAEEGATVCKDCKAAETKACTGTVDCTADFHKDDCLSQCKMGDTCENTTGVPSAHKETYTVAWTLTVTAYTRDPGTGNVTSTKTTTNGSEENIPDMAGVQTFVNSKVAIDENNADEFYSGAEDTKWVSKICRYKVTTVHCPKAGVADSTVLGATDEGETTDPTDPEVKAPEKAEDFSDLKGDEWYAEELTALMEKGVFKGSLDDGKYSFNATGNVTGAELVVLLSRVAGEDLVTTGTEWNKAATEWAAEAGYTEGVDITTTGKMTRQDVILVLWRAAGKPASEQSLEDFADAEGLEGDYLSAMKWAVEKGIIKGDGDTGALKADANITRAEMVSVLTRYSNAK